MPTRTPTPRAPSTKASAAKVANGAPAKSAPAKPSKSRSTPSTKKGRGPKKPAPGDRKVAARSSLSKPAFVPRAMTHPDDDDVLMAHGGGGGGFGRCGGRLLSNSLEQQLCSRLGIAGVVHSHSPRHYEIRYNEGQVAAYAPMIVLRGRGREGKGVVIEAVEEAKAPILRKTVAFRDQYGQEFYIILVASDEVLDQVPLAAYDESCSSTNVNTLIARLAE
ncbi:MAG TPA: hypothetical protein VFZ65_09800 [Planctomycetota bacterium]|nr:hypothetical protein [Planctomycetota bacterium]